MQQPNPTLPEIIPIWIVIVIIVLFSMGRYFILAGLVYLLCYVPGLKKLQRFKIQKGNPEKTQVLFELKYSISTVFIFSMMGLLTYHLYVRNLTKIYLDVHEFGITYLFGSFLIIVLFHDAYFYWTHRLLHSKWLFKRVHSVHHQSFNPTPWAAYAFHPIEALLESLVILPIVMLIPVHVGVLLSFTFLVLAMNVMGHLGFEFYSKSFRASRLGKFLTSSTHHNLHHQVGSRNFGYYFTFWDRVMSTFKD